MQRKKLINLGRCLKTSCGLVGVIEAFFLCCLFTSSPIGLVLFTFDKKVLDLLSTVWPLVVWSQIVNCLSFVYDGLLFGLGEFKFLRRHMFLGAVLTFLPLGFWSYSGESLTAIWLGLIALNIYRLFSGYFRTKTLMSAAPS